MNPHQPFVARSLQRSSAPHPGWAASALAGKPAEADAVEWVNNAGVPGRAILVGRAAQDCARGLIGDGAIWSSLVTVGGGAARPIVGAGPNAGETWIQARCGTAVR